jgi:hypothetical protein
MDARAAPEDESVLERLDRLEQRQAELEAAVLARDERIRELEATTGPAASVIRCSTSTTARPRRRRRSRLASTPS